MGREIASLRATLHLSCGKIQQLGVAVDGARFGRPARSYNLGFLTDPLGGVHSVLPPSVPRFLLLSDCVFVSGLNPSSLRHKQTLNQLAIFGGCLGDLDH